MSDSNEVVTDPRLEKRTRRRFSVTEKKRLLAEAEELPHGQKGAWLRRNGLFAGQLSNWRKELAWDITKLPTITRGVYLCLYVILDLFSRYAVGWMVSRKENAGLARHLFSEVLSRRAIAPGSLIVHQDRGSPMIAHSFGELLSDLGVQRSFSRPRVSNDNAFSESQFKTTKYSPSYPGRFRDIEHARQWCGEFFPAMQRQSG